ncbi:MAG: hypothetical protein DIU78_021625 [Pseudomonadota bacterium]
MNDPSPGVASPTRASVGPHASASAAAAAFRDKNWELLAELATSLPERIDSAWLATADKCAFGLSQLGRYEEAETIQLRAWEVEETHRRASALAYFAYAALLRHKNRKPRLADPEAARKKFEHWIAKALELDPRSITDHYRLGVYHASVRRGRDVPALASFRTVLRLFSELPAADRAPTSRYFKRYVQSLYGAGRSALRLGRLDEARRYAFQCIRVDRERQHVAEVFKLFLAAQILVAQGHLDDAERGLRLALEAPHEGDRDFVYGLLAKIALARSQPEDAAAWIELNVRPHLRKPYLWRLLGEAEDARGRHERALRMYKSALLKDRTGRHRTLLLQGRLLERLGRTREARRAYEQAADFRRRRYLKEDGEALRALAELCERSGDLEGAKAALRRMSGLPLLADWASAELERLAG